MFPLNFSQTKTQLKAMCAASDSKPCPLEMQALITLYPLFPLFPLCLRSSDQLWAESGLCQEVVVCRILDLDLIYCRCERMQGTAGGEGKIWQEGPKDFVWRDWTLHKVSAEL